MRLDTNRHPAEEEIEKYSMGGLTEEECSRFEEHLLICESCQNRVTETDTYVSTMLSASALVRQRGRRAEKRWWQLRPWVPIGAAAVAVLVLSSLGVEWIARRNGGPGNPAPAYALNLVATRGNGIEAKAPEGRTLVLHLDLAGLTPEASYRLELVDGQGARVWEGSVSPQDSQ